MTEWTIEEIAQRRLEDLESCQKKWIQLRAELASLRGFIEELFELSDWPEGGDIDGFDFQDAAVKHGLLIPEQCTEPCGEGCNCNQYYSDAEWAEGITCYRLAAALKTKEPK